MTDFEDRQPDRFEDQLRTLRPRDLSDAVRCRIAERIEAERRRTGRLRSWAMPVGLAAAALLTLALWAWRAMHPWPGEGPVVTQNDSPDQPAGIAEPLIAREPPPPTLWALREAAGSADGLAELLAVRQEALPGAGAPLPGGMRW